MKSGDVEAGVVMVRRPLERGNEFFFGGYVHDVSVSTVNADTYVLSKCWSSQHKSTKYEQKLVLQDTSPSFSTRVVFARCDGCVAGSDGGLCSHVFAVLMVLEKYRTDGTTPVTSLPCSWGPRKRDLEPKPIMDVTVEKASMERKGPPITCTLYESRAQHLRSITMDKVGALRQSLPHDCSLRSLLPPKMSMVKTEYSSAPLGSPLSYQRKPVSEASQPSPAPVPTMKKFPPLPLPSKTECSPVGLVWPCSLQEAQSLERRTIGQSSSKVWMERHMYTLTASNFHRILHCTTGQEKLLSSLFDQQSLQNVPAIRHGKAHEQQAVEKYKSVKSSAGQPVFLRNCGLVLDTVYKYIGASPDGLVFDRSARPTFGLLEVKCPFTAFEKSLTITEAAGNDRNFCLQKENGILQLSRRHPYYLQVQGQLGVSRMTWCDFLVWVGESYHLERINADVKLFQECILPRLAAFYAEYAIPYLQERNRPVPPVSADEPMPSAAADIVDVDPWSKYETLLTPDLAQSTIDGRNGSNACTIISAVFVRNSLQSAAADGEIDGSASAMCQAMREGNSKYDSLHTNSLLSADEVVSLQPSLGVSLCSESFVRPSCLDTMVSMMHDQSQAGAAYAFGGVFVVTPYSFSMTCCRGRFILFDSHSHTAGGALLANVPVSDGASYLEYFFAHYYAHIDFAPASSGNSAAHMTYLTVDVI